LGSEVARVWLGQFQLTCGCVLILGANSALLRGEEILPWRECLK